MSEKNITIFGENNQSIPLILDSPHSGTTYPTDFNHQADFMKLRQAHRELLNQVNKIIEGSISLTSLIKIWFFTLS